MTTKYNELLLKAQRDIIMTNCAIITLLGHQKDSKSATTSLDQLIKGIMENCEQINDFLGLE